MGVLFINHSISIDASFSKLNRISVHRIRASYLSSQALSFLSLFLYLPANPFKKRKYFLLENARYTDHTLKSIIRAETRKKTVEKSTPKASPQKRWRPKKRQQGSALAILSIVLLRQKEQSIVRHADSSHPLPLPGTR